MKLTFLGTGSAFTVGEENYQSNLLLESDNSRLLIDCGSDARHALYRLNLGYRDIEHVYISHLHADHAGGLEWLGFARKFDPVCDKPTLYIHESMIDSVWEHMLSAGMKSIEGMHCHLETYFEPQAVSEDFSWEKIGFTTIQTKHVFDGDKQQPCYALFFTINDISIFFTADAAFTPELFVPYYEAADYIFHDCEILQEGSGVHANYKQLCQLEGNIKKKMWLYHYNPLPLPDAKADGFQGFVLPRQSFDFTDVSTFKG